MKWIFVCLVILFIACNSNDNTSEKSSLNSLDSNTANNTATVNSDKIAVQGFTQIPSIINGCSGLFVTDTTNEEMRAYYFVSNLKGVAFIKLNNRLMELKLVKQTNVDKYTVNELYVNDEVEVDLKIKQLGEGTDANWDYNGVLIVTRGLDREAITIFGKLGC
jgi:hypothetical protein